MKKYVYGLGALVAPSLIGMLVATGCTKEDGTSGLPTGDDICGPCGEIAKGDVGISGDVRLDGFFKALGNVQVATASIKADFDANIRALAATYDVNLTGDINAAAVAQLTAAIRADFDANLQGAVSVDYQPPRCEASVNVAVQAQAQCEVKAGCEVDVNPGEVSVACEGQCSGGCSAECTGDFSCEVEAPSIECTGRCEGACNLEAGATCNGTCRGTCDGECSAQDGSGNCAGTCDGECTGTCELAVAAECSGSCTGKCLVNQGSAQCTGDVSCRGTCEGSCTGGCEGNFTPPSASAECEAAADCQASAKAEANASLECSPPQLKLDYTLAGNAGANVQAKTEFMARMTELKARGIAIVQGAARYEALLTGKVEGRTVFNPSPLAELQASVTAMADASAWADLDIPVAKAACIVPAFQEAGRMLTSLGTSTQATLQAQASFVSAFTAGFPEDT
jgi:modification target Cys-rich repeat protein